MQKQTKTIKLTKILLNLIN